MSYSYIEYQYPNSNVIQKQILWLSVDCNLYFAMKLLESDDWTYFAGTAGHALATGLLLTTASSEVEAQTNYLTTTKDANDKFLAMLPGTFEAKFIRVYIEDGSGVQIHEWRPSIYITAHEIVTGRLEIDDALSDAPSIRVKVSGDERLYLGNLGDDIYGIRGRDSSGEIIFQIGSDEDNPYVSNYTDTQALELELMKMNFQNISWAQFAIYDALNDETKRASPDPSTFDAVLSKSKLTNGGDVTVDREFGFVSETYANINIIESGTSTSVGLNFLTDTGKSWFTDEVRTLTLTDALPASFTVSSNTSNTLTVAGTPTAGAYTLTEDNPTYAVAFCTYLDSTNGGYGFTKLEIAFDNSNYQEFLNTQTSVNLLGATVAIDDVGNDYKARLTLINDGSGNGAIVYNFLCCTDPSPWRW